MFSGFGGRLAFRKKKDKRMSSSTESQFKSVEMSSRLFMSKDTPTSSRSHTASALKKPDTLTLDVPRSKSSSSSPIRKLSKPKSLTPGPLRRLSPHQSFPPYSQESLDYRETGEWLRRPQAVTKSSALQLERKRSSSDSKKTKGESLQKNRNRANSDSKSKWTLAMRFGLNNVQKKAILTSWQRLCDFRNPHSAVLVMENVFETLAKTPKVRTMFLSSAFLSTMVLKQGREMKIQTIRDHAKFLAWFLTKVIECLDEDPKEILEAMAEFGSQHAHLKGLGFDGKMWEKFGQLLVDHMVVQESLRHSPYAAKAWTVLLAGIVDMICSGFLQPKRKQSACHLKT